MLVNFFGGRFPLIVVYAIGLHMLWAVMLMFDRSVSGVTAVWALTIFLSRPVCIVLLIVVAMMASMAAFMLKNKHAAAMFMIPQQMVLFLSAGGAIEAMVASKFPDGVLRPSVFIIADQAPVVLAAFCHMMATLHVWKGSGVSR